MNDHRPRYMGWPDLILWTMLAVGVVAKVGADNQENRTLAVLLGIMPRHPILDPAWCVLSAAAILLLGKLVSDAHRKDT
jgi:hypothetical protein